MNISRKDWNNYIDKLRLINEKASELIEAYVEQNGFDDIDALIAYADQVATKYSLASASMNALMYDVMAELEKVILPPAELAELPTYGDVAKAVQGTLKTSQNPKEIGGAVSRLVKLTGQDTMLKNAIRDKAEFAWIPNGDTCPFCLMLASNGWQPISKRALKKGHAEHIHANCDCAYMVRHSSDVNVAGYNPEEYQRMYYNAKGQTTEDKLNYMRRENYAKNREDILEQKASAYEKRKELNSSMAEESDVN